MPTKPQVVDHPLARVLLTRLRDRRTGAPDFRAAVEGLTTILLVEALKDVETSAREVQTPLAPATGADLAQPVVFCPILRAGLGMVPPALRLLPDAEVRHVGLYRDEITLSPVSYYDRLGEADLADGVVVLLDPMLATAGTATAAVALLRQHNARDVRFVGLLGSPEGIEALSAADPEARVTLAAVDDRLSSQDDPWPPGFIVPGLGDAGDRQFST